MANDKDEPLFTENGWIVSDKDLPKKREERAKPKVIEASGTQYLTGSVKKELELEQTKSKPVSSSPSIPSSPKQDQKPSDGKNMSTIQSVKAKDGTLQLRVMVVGAHPDDADLFTGGLTLRLTGLGHRVKYVSVTNGNAGHHKRGPNELAFIRENEAKRAAAALGAEYECLGVNDGHVWVNEENMRLIVRVIREFSPDLLITHRTNDYHRDHRYTSQLIMDASYMLIVPLYCPEFPPKTRDMPIIAYAYDNFKKPSIFQTDIILNLSDIFTKKVAAVSNHESQLFEWLPWTMKMENVINEETDREKRMDLAGMIINNQFGSISERYMSLLKELFPGQECVSFEAYEICEYGRQPKKKDLKQLFPNGVFPKKEQLKPFIEKD